MRALVRADIKDQAGHAVEITTALARDAGILMQFGNTLDLLTMIKADDA